jgi:hypothetical protein
MHRSISVCEPNFQGLKADSQRRHARACSEWDASKQPALLTSEVFSQQIQPFGRNVGIRYRATNLSLALVRWPPPRRLPTASEALECAGGTGGRCSMRVVYHTRSRGVLVWVWTPTRKRGLYWAVGAFAYLCLFPACSTSFS